MSIKHTSAQHDGLSQLDSVFAQIRQKAISAKAWELEVESNEEGTLLTLNILHGVKETPVESPKPEAPAPATPAAPPAAKKPKK